MGGEKKGEKREEDLRKVEEVLDSGSLGALSRARGTEEDEDLARVEGGLLEELLQKLKLRRGR